jgi:hypothetical protein
MGIGMPLATLKLSVAPSWGAVYFMLTPFKGQSKDYGKTWYSTYLKINTSWSMRATLNVVATIAGITSDNSGRRSIMYGWNDSYKPVSFEVLTGRKIVGVKIEDDKEQMRIRCEDGSEILMCHEQDCCESVSIEDIAGDLDDLISTVLEAEESANSEENPDGIKREYQDSFTWTFYKIQTMKGAVTIRWYGESNGYYSESVSVYETRWKPEPTEEPEPKEDTVVAGVTGEWK